MTITLKRINVMWIFDVLYRRNLSYRHQQSTANNTDHSYNNCINEISDKQTQLKTKKQIKIICSNVDWRRYSILRFCFSVSLHLVTKRRHHRRPWSIKPIHTSSFDLKSIFNFSFSMWLQQNKQKPYVKCSQRRSSRFSKSITVTVHNSVASHPSECWLAGKMGISIGCQLGWPFSFQRTKGKKKKRETKSICTWNSF